MLTRDSVLDYLGEVTIAPITTTFRGLPSEILLTQGDGMPKTCAINLDHIQTASKAKLGPLIAVLPASRMAEVRSAMLFALGFGRD